MEWGGGYLEWQPFVVHSMSQGTQSMVLHVHLLGFVQYVNYHLTQLYYLWVDRADQKHVNNLSLLRPNNNIRCTRENFK